MVDIQITNTQLAKYEINFEQAKEYLQSELQKYQNLVVSEEFMQMAKKSRAELNAKRKELQSRFTEVKKKHNEPIDMLKTKVDELLGLIDEPLNKIDEQIKRYEIEVKKQKEEMIKEIFENAKGDFNINLEMIFNPKWLNVDYSKKKITEEITFFFERCKKDLEVIESFEDEFVIPLKQLYMECFDMSTVMQKKIAYDKQKQELLKAEQERKLKEQQEEMKRKFEEEQAKKFQETNKVLDEVTGINENQDIEDEIYDEIPEIQDEITSENDNEGINIPTEQENADKTQPSVSNEEINPVYYIEFWVRVTEEQKLLMREFILKNNIECGKIKR